MTAASTFNASTGDGYELLMGRWSRRLAVPFLAFAGVASGERVLDVGCGTGSLTFLLSQRPDVGAVCGVDYAPPYIEYAARNSSDDPRVSFRLADACALPFPDAAFDRVLSLLMLHFVVEPHRAVAEMRRVARPGATVAAAVWDARGLVANRLFFDTAAALDPAASFRRARHFTRPMTRPGELASAWHQAGLAGIEATELAIRMEFACFDDYWTPYVGKDGPIAEYVATLDEQAVVRLREAVRAAYLDGDPDGARSYVAVAWAVKGIVPC
jgi:SAM-dependent methyltransferase